MATALKRSSAAARSRIFTLPSSSHSFSPRRVILRNRIEHVQPRSRTKSQSPARTARPLRLGKKTQAKLGRRRPTSDSSRLASLPGPPVQPLPQPSLLRSLLSRAENLDASKTIFLWPYVLVQARPSLAALSPQCRQVGLPWRHRLLPLPPAPFPCSQITLPLLTLGRDLRVGTVDTGLRRLQQRRASRPSLEGKASSGSSSRRRSSHIRRTSWQL